MYVRDEIDYQILKNAENKLNTIFDWQIKDDDMTGIVNEDAFVIIDNLCSEIDRLQEKLEEKIEYVNDYPNEEEDRERKVLGI